MNKGGLYPRKIEFWMNTRTCPAKLHSFIVHNTIIREYFARSETRKNGGRGKVLQNYYLYGCLCNSEEKQQHIRIYAIKQSITYPHNTAHYCHFAKCSMYDKCYMLNLLSSLREILLFHSTIKYDYCGCWNSTSVKSQLQSNNRAEMRWSRAWNYYMFHFPNLSWYENLAKKNSRNFK